MKYLKVVVVVFLCLVQISCSTLQGFKNPVKDGSLYGMIIDEKNQPVSDFKIVCQDGRKTVSNAVTNSSGIFVIENIVTGEVSICGSKNGYIELKNETLDFTGTKDVFCWQINSAEGVLENVEKYIQLGDYELAVEAMKNLKVASGSEEEKLIKQLKSKLNKKGSKKAEEKNEIEKV